MNKLYNFTKVICLLIFVLGIGQIAQAQVDTIPPKMNGCGDTIKVQKGSVFILVLPAVSDNMTDSADIMVSSKWGANGAVNTLVDGLYTLTITAFDTSGNVMRCIRYYKVGDFIPPTYILRNTSVELKVFPNPSNELLNIQLNEWLKNAQVLIYSATGQLVYEAWIGNNASIDTRPFANGIYSILVKNNLGVYKQALIIQH